MIKHVSYKIQNAIQIELFSAKESIKIAVAWFTNELLLHPLVLKLQTGVSVEIILNDDNINKGGESSLDFTSFLEAGGVLRWNTSKQLLHEKFCIIDDRIVISGSYNWTNKAEYNDEVETFYFDEQETCGFFNSQFLKLQRKYEATKRIRPTQAAEIEELEEKITTNEPILEEPKYFIDEYGVVYSENKKILLKGVDIYFYSVIEGTKEIADEAFANFTTLQYIKMPESLCKIGERAFFHCDCLQAIRFPAYIRSIGKEAFRGCDNIWSIKLDEVENIGDYCFSDCGRLERVEIKKFIIRYNRGEGIFAGCARLKMVNIGNLSTVYRSMFKDCYSLEEMKQPVGDIYDGAFYKCISLKRITLSTNCQRIGESAFENCSNLEIIKKEETKEHNLRLSVNIYKEQIKRIKQYRKRIIENSGNEEQVMDYNLKLECSEKEYAILSELQSGNCSFIYQVDISSKAFKGCAKLINIHADEVYINGSETFTNCEKMKTFFLAWSIPMKIHEPSVEFCKTFENCVSLEFCSITFHSEYRRYNREKPEYSNINTGVKEIKYEKTFKNCYKLTHIGRLLAVRYTIMGDETFYGCTNLKAIGNSVLIPLQKRIGDKAFYNCKELYMSALLSPETTFSKKALLGSNLKIVQYKKNPDRKKLISQ